MATRDDPQFRIRLPANLKKRIEKSAQEAGRSLNTEIEKRLADSFKPIQGLEPGINAALPFFTQEERLVLGKLFGGIAERIRDENGNEES